VRDRTLAVWLVRFYPPSFRAAVGDDLADAVVDSLAARRRAGVRRSRAVLAAVADAVRNAPAAWARAAADALADRRRDNPGADPGREGSMLDTLLKDLRFGWRSWRRRPGLAALALSTLALGIGVNTAMFSIVNGVLLRALPFRNAERLVLIWGRTPAAPQTVISYREFQEFRRENRTFDDVALWLTQSVNLTGSGEPQRITGSFVSGSFFDVVGLTAERGRLFTQADSQPASAAMVAVITHQFWQQRYNGDPAAVGSTVTLNGLPLTIVGITAPPFDTTRAPGGGYFVDVDAFIPAALLPVPGGVEKAGPQFLGVGRTKRSVVVETANADLDVIARRLQAAYPDEQRDRTTNLVPLQEMIVGSSRTPLLLLLASVGVVLLIACVNVGNLLMARAVDRRREIAVRAALGASRVAVVRQLGVEAALLAGAAAGLGLLLGRWALRLVAWLRPPGVPIPDVVPLDATVLLFTSVTAVIVAIFCALAPAIRIWRTDLNHFLQAGNRRTTGTGRRTRDVLVAAEIALSVALVALAGLLIQSILAIQRTSLGFETTNVFTLQFRLPATKYRTPDDIVRFFKAAHERVSAVPGVTSAALVRRVPLSGNRGTIPFTRPGQPANAALNAGENMISPGYFRTMEIPIMRGRDFAERDDLGAPAVVIVNQTLVRVAFNGDDPIGRSLDFPGNPIPSATIVGVVGDTKHLSPTEPPQPQVYIPHYQAPLIFSSLVARTAGPPLSVASDVRRAIWSVDKDQPMWSVSSLEQIVARTFGQTTFLASLLSLFAALALALAAIGVYGVMSYSVTERTHEIGIRLALGASSARVRAEVVAHGLSLTMAAVVLGIFAAIALGRAVRSVLFEVTPADPLALAGASALLILVSLAACYIPARRASRVDPVVALSEQ
jgi:putative ABC transport system permease protein